MTHNTCSIGIFAREPVAGATKTRLIPLLGAAGAAQFHQRCIRAAVRTAQHANLGSVTLYITPAMVENSFFSTLQPTPPCVLQSGDDLGARMHNAFVHGLARASRMIIIGTDCPALTVAHLNAVSHWLAQNQGACFIPAEDGGYVLVGLSKPCAALFADITWGSDMVMQQTRVAAFNAGVPLHALPPLWDIDTPNDYHRLAGDALLSGILKD